MGELVPVYWNFLPFLSLNFGHPVLVNPSMGLFVTSLKVHLSWVKVHVVVDTAFGLHISFLFSNDKGVK